MNYYNQPPQHQHHLQSRVKQLQADKTHLSQAIEQLNMCYMQKIHLLENTINQQQQKYQELLEWKQGHIDKSLFEVERYEIQIKKMIEILDTAHHNFELEKDSLVKEIRSQEDQMRQLRQENEALSQFNQQNEYKLEEMVRIYTEQIEKLKQQLRELREQSVVSEDQSLMALRDISKASNISSVELNQKMSNGERDPILSKISIQTLGQ